MNVLFHLTYLFIFFEITVANFNQEPTYSNLGHTNSNGTQITISSDESIIAVGFSDGTLKLFSIDLIQVCSAPSTNSSEITDLIWLPSFGPVSLDESNTITLWSLDCTITNSISFTSPVTGITGHQIDDGNGTMIGIVAVNLQDRIEEYDIQTGDQTLVYNFDSNQTSLEMIYNADGDSIVLLVGMSGEIVRKFQIDNGTEIDSFLVESPIQQMSKISVYTGDVVIGRAQNNHVIRFDSAGEVLDRGNFPESVAITTCPTTKQFALAHSSTSSIGIYLYAGQIQQTITSLYGLPQDIDCSASYLVSVDEKGYINVYTYEEFKSWIIAIIAGVVGGLVLLVAIVILVIKLRRRWAEKAKQEQTKGKIKNKYPRSLQKSPNKQQSVQMLKLSTLETTMRQ